MTVTYPCSFEEAAQESLEEMLPDLKPGSFRKVRTLSEAIHGKVKLVESYLPNTPKTFVVKQIPRAAALDCRQIECPRNEIYASLAITQALDVPHAAEILFAAKDESFFYLASEHCPNGELLSVINKAGRLKGDDMLREVLCQILVCIGALHQAGIAHRDLSLENVLVASDGSLRIIDFAQAVMVHAQGDSAGEARISPGEHGPPGKPQYRGPELSTGAPYLATKVDAFAIGVMLYALIVGTYPFAPKGSRIDPNRIDLFPVEQAGLGRCTHLQLQLRQVNKGIAEQISPGCLDILEQLLAPNPELRLSVEEALMHPWLTGAVSGLWSAAGDEDSTDEDVSTYCSGDADTMTDCSDNVSLGDHAD